MKEHGAGDERGCERCWPHEAEAAWEARPVLATVAELVHESHYSVKILSCPSCGQNFLSVFTEWVDWAGGEDPMYWTVVPVDTGEVAALTDPKGALGETELEAMARGRPCLLVDYPKGVSKPTAAWGIGLRIGPHD